MSRDLLHQSGLGLAIVEQQLALGWGVLGLAAVAVCAPRGERGDSRIRRRVWPLLAVALSAAALSLAPLSNDCTTATLSASCAVHAVAPMFRAFARFGVVTGLMIAVVAGLGFDRLTLQPACRERRRRGGHALAVGLLALIVAELWPFPWRTRDVLPTEGHRWLAGQPASIRALDCAAWTVADSNVPWLMQRDLRFASRLDDCGDLDFLQRVAVGRYTHVLVRRSTPASWAPDRPLAGLRSVALFRDSRVYAVDRIAPTVVAETLPGFYPLERGPEGSWRWLGQHGGWLVRNATGSAAMATLHLDLTAFARARQLAISLDGKRCTTLEVPPGRSRHIVDLQPLAPGDHHLGFEALEAATRADDVEGNGDARLLTVMFRPWRWETRAIGEAGTQ